MLSAAPTITLPATETVQDGGAGFFFGDIPISAPDADASDQESVVVQATSGTLSFDGPLNPNDSAYLSAYPGTASVTNPDGSYYLFNSNEQVAYQGSGTATGYVAITGTAYGIDDCLSNLEYLPPPLLGSGSAVLSVLAENAGGANPTTRNVPINVTPSSIPPVVEGPFSQTITPGTLTFSPANHNAITLNDPDSNGGTVTADVEVMNGTLNTGPDTSGLTALTGNGTSWLRFDGTVPAVNAALDGLEYTPNAGIPGDFLDVSIMDPENFDSDGETNLLGTVITVVSTPTPELDFGVSNQSTAEHVSAASSAGLTFSTADGNPVIVSGADNTKDSLTAVLEVLNGTLTVPNSSAPVTTAGNGSSLIGLTGTPAAIDEALDGLNYQPLGTAAADVLEGFVTTPGSTNSPPLSTWIPITVDSGTEDLPTVIGVPAAQTVKAGSVLTFSHSDGGFSENDGVSSENGSNAITVTDGDANSSIETVYLQVLYGTLAVSNTSGLTSATGNATNLVILSGTVQNLNAAIDGLRYVYATPAETGSSGSGANSDYLSILISDNAPDADNSSSAGVTIDITPGYTPGEA